MTVSPKPSVTVSPKATAAAGTDRGTYVLSSQAETVPDKAHQCFIEAVKARRPAWLKSTRPTPEGASWTQGRLVF